MVMPYVNTFIIKYVEHIFDKQLQNGDCSGNVEIMRVISILKKMNVAQEISLTTSECLFNLSSRKY